MNPPAGTSSGPRWPWIDTLATLRERFREDRLGVTASSLTFTTLISLVPLVTVMLALFSAFPMFGQLLEALQGYFVAAVVPDAIAKPVMNAVTQFATKASRLGAVGVFVFLASAMALMLTIDRTLNAIWRVQQPRPLAQRVLVHWAAITLGPLLVAGSIGATSFAISASKDLHGFWGEALTTVLTALEFGLLAAAFAALYHYVPNTPVRWSHAVVGGVFAALGLLLAKQLLAIYLKAVPTFALVYGAFATLPILLIWIYVAWVVVLFGAVIAAYAPALTSGVRRRPSTPGLGLQLALEVIALLHDARERGTTGLAQGGLARTLRIDPLQLEPVIDALIGIDWLGQLDEAGSPRLVMLCDPVTTPAAPLLDRLLLVPTPATEGLRRRLSIETVMLADLLPAQRAAQVPAARAGAPAVPLFRRRPAEPAAPR
jgi:membrane protein